MLSDRGHPRFASVPPDPMNLARALPLACALWAIGRWPVEQALWHDAASGELVGEVRFPVSCSKWGKEALRCPQGLMRGHPNHNSYLQFKTTEGVVGWRRFAGGGRSTPPSLERTDCLPMSRDFLNGLGRGQDVINIHCFSRTLPFELSLLEYSDLK